MKYPWLDLAKNLQAIAQAGLAYTQSEFDKERYEIIREISVKIVSDFAETDFEKAKCIFACGVGYPTPKVEVRAVIFRDDEILMVKEKADKKWALPGGWADAGLSAFENAKKEVFEEAGICVKPLKLLAVFDKSKHDYPAGPYDIYQFLILCKYIEGELTPGLETLDVRYFQRGEIPELSRDRTIEEDLDLIYEFFDNPDKPIVCD